MARLQMSALRSCDVLISWVRYSWLNTENAEMLPVLGVGCLGSAGLLAGAAILGFLAALTGCSFVVPDGLFSVAGLPGVASCTQG